jgi:3'-phosphoadenosine 5'-phosphosulfate sulfotransferase (PAPS reductase)/FAD synthetase
MHGYDRYVVTFSGGKDSTACFLHLLEIGIPREKIELWHHDVDGHGPLFMDWECTPDYCRKFAEAFGVPIYFSWKEGGFLREMLREQTATAPIYFETPDGLKSKGGDGPLNTRRKFPQVTADLKTRWCSAYLKIDVGATALRNQDRFNNSRTLVISGERGEESPARAKYAILEPDRADGRDGKKKRLVDRWRPIRDWTEQEVWDIIKRWNVRVHPAYYLGWGRVSCKFCIFGNSNQFASAFKVSPVEGVRMIALEKEFGCTMKRNKDLNTLQAEGTPYESMNDFMISVAKSYEYKLSIFTNHWVLPAGAFGESSGPT